MGKLHMDEIQETEGVWGTRSLLLNGNYTNE
jgi:hypothetical protein